MYGSASASICALTAALTASIGMAKALELRMSEAARRLYPNLRYQPAVRLFARVSADKSNAFAARVCYC
jgi:hypothetical protein